MPSLPTTGAVAFCADSIKCLGIAYLSCLPSRAKRARFKQEILKAAAKRKDWRMLPGRPKEIKGFLFILNRIETGFQNYFLTVFFIFINS
jgi:hypothetical protein